MTTLKITRSPGCPHPLPAYETPGAAGMDLRAWLPDGIRVELYGVRGSTGDYVLDVVGMGVIGLPPGARMTVPLGISMAIPDGHEGVIRGRSGLALREGLQVHVATIDSDYRGELAAIVSNPTGRTIVITDGQRIAQLIIHPVTRVHVVEVDAGELGETARGDGGFGSTGKG